MVTFLYLMICLWLWIVPIISFNMSNSIKDIYNPSTFNPIQTKDYNPLLDSVIDTIMTSDNKIPFLEIVKQAESKHKKTAKNPKSTAKGLYQFLDGTVKNVKNQGVNIGIDEEYIKNIPNNPHNWTEDQSDVMALINFFVQRGTNKNLEKAIKHRDLNAMTELYYKNHVTGEIDNKTKLNWNRALASYKPKDKTKGSWLYKYISSFFK